MVLVDFQRPKVYHHSPSNCEKAKLILTCFETKRWKKLCKKEAKNSLSRSERRIGYFAWKEMYFERRLEKKRTLLRQQLSASKQQQQW